MNTPPQTGSPLLAAGDVDRPDRDSAVPDVDWNWSHLVVRPPHLRDLDVTDPRIPGHRHEVEVDDAVCDELLHPGVRDLGPEEPRRALGDHERRAAGPPDDLPEEHVRENADVTLGPERLGHRSEGVDDQADDPRLVDVPYDLLPDRGQAFLAQRGHLEEPEQLLLLERRKVEAEAGPVSEARLAPLQHVDIQ